MQDAFFKTEVRSDGQIPNLQTYSKHLTLFLPATPQKQLFLLEWQSLDSGSEHVYIFWTLIKHISTFVSYEHLFNSTYLNCLLCQKQSEGYAIKT